jgi:hypothetical protein
MPIDKISTWAKLAAPAPEDPPQTRKDDGWQGGEQPEAEYWNYLEQEDRDTINLLIDESNPNTQYRVDMNATELVPGSTAFIQGLRPTKAGGYTFSNDNNISVDRPPVPKDLSYTSIDGTPKILVLSSSPAVYNRVDVYDVATRTYESNSGTNFDAGLPSGGGQDWIGTSLCNDGTHVYVMFYNNAASPNETHYVQAYALSDWSVKTGWPSTGRALTGTGLSAPFSAGYAVDRIRWVTSTKLAVTQNWNDVILTTDKGMAIVDATDGTILTEGTGALTPGGAADHIVTTGGIASDGLYIYFSYIGYDISATLPVEAGVGCALISDLTTARGGWSGGAGGANDICLDLVYDGHNVLGGFQDYALAPALFGGSTVQSWDVASGEKHGPILTPFETDKVNFSISFILYDGVNIWLHGSSIRDVGSPPSDENRGFLYRINPGCLHKNDDGADIEWEEASYKGYWTNVGVQDRTDPGPMTFDGRDIWYIGKLDSSTSFQIMPFATTR